MILLVMYSCCLVTSANINRYVSITFITTHPYNDPYSRMTSTIIDSPINSINLNDDTNDKITINTKSSLNLTLSAMTWNLAEKKIKVINTTTIITTMTTTVLMLLLILILILLPLLLLLL